MSNQAPIRDYKPSLAATQTRRVATAALFVAIGVALSPFSVPVLGAKAFPVQSFLNVLGAVFLGPLYTVLVALIISVIRNATGLGTPLAYMGSMIGALLAALAYWSVMLGVRTDERSSIFPRRMLLAIVAAAAGEIIGTGILGALADGAIVAPVILHHHVLLTIYLIPFLLAGVIGSFAACIGVIALWRVRIRPSVSTSHT